MFELTGRVALVTGAGTDDKGLAGGRIGFGIAQTLASQGAVVAVNDINPLWAQAAVDAIIGQGGKAIVAAFDITDAHAVDEAFSKIREAVGPVDILVNNAGLYGAKQMTTTPFADMDPSTWTIPVNINLWGGLNCVRAALPEMKAAGWGRIVYISSEAGRMGFPVNISMYGAAKAAGAHFMRHLAHEVGKMGITCNIISTGLIEGSAPPEIDQMVLATIPARRLGRRSDIGAAVAFFASNEAEWINGQTLPVEGGMNTFN